MFIDPHVHCRDWLEYYKETVPHALKVAESQGIGAIFDMPNTNPLILSEKDVVSRLLLAEKAGSPVFYGLYIGLTPNPKQVEEAVRAWRKYFPRLAGLKLFAGKSVGGLSVTDEKAQEHIYKTLASCGYKGMLVVHCEKQSLMLPGLWNPEKPVTHAYARPPETEIEAVKDQIAYAANSGFEGNVHITHVSVPESVRLVNDARNSIRISCGATPHHCLLDNSLMESENGIIYKANPPIRDRNSADTLLFYLHRGDIDYLETDHAPHTIEEKLKEPFMSGIPNLAFYSMITDKLKHRGFSEKRIEEITNTRIQELFRMQINEKELRTGGDFSKDYAFNPYSCLG